MLLTLKEQASAKAANEGQKLRLAGHLELSCFALDRCASQTCIACCGLPRKCVESVTGLMLPNLNGKSKLLKLQSRARASE